jgi:hypothetical protein
MPVIIVRISGTCFLINNTLGTQGKGNLTFSSQVNFLSKQLKNSDHVQEILHHFILRL